MARLALWIAFAALVVALPITAQEPAESDPVAEAAAKVAELRAAEAAPAELALAVKELAIAQHGAKQAAAAVTTFQEALALFTAAHGASSKEVADTWLWLGFIATSQSDYPVAVDAYRKMHAIYLELEGPEHKMTAQAAFGLGFALMEIGGENEAVGLFEQAYEVRKALTAEAAPGTQYALEQYGRALRAVARYEDAETAMREHVRVAEEAHGTESMQAAMARYNLGAVFEEIADFPSALREHERALAILESILEPGHTSLAVALGNVARCREASGSFDDALELSRRAHAIWQSARGDENGRTARALSDVGLCLFRMGRYSEAVEAYESALATCRRILPEDHPLTGSCLHRLALALQDLGAYERARPLYEESIAIDRRNGSGVHASTGTRISLLGKLLWLQGQSSAARQKYEEALEVLTGFYDEAHPLVAYCQRDLGLLDLEEGQVEEAKLRFEQSAEIWREVYGERHREIALAEHDIASALDRLGRTDQARTLFERVLTDRRALFDGDHEHTAETLHALGALHRRGGDLAKAASLFEEALGMRERALGNNHPETIETLRERALLEWGRGDLDAACSTAFEMQRRLDAHIAQVTWSLTESERFQFLRRRYVALELLVNLAAAADTPAITNRAYDAVLEWKGGASRALLASRDRLAANASAETEGLLNELRGVQSQLTRQLFQNDLAAPQARDAQLADLRARRSELELELARLSGRVASPPAPDWTALRDALPANSVWIDFTFLKASSDPQALLQVDAWIVRPGDEHVQRIALGEADAMQAKAGAFLEDLVANRGAAPAVAAAKSPNDELREALWAPLAESIGKAELIFVNPASFLGGLPLETLRLADGRFVLEHHAVVYLSDATALVSPREPSSATDLLCIGDVAFGKPTASAAQNPWSPLPATRAEVESVAALHAATFESSARRFFGGDQATKAKFREAALQSGVIHVATHGFFEREGLEWMWEESFEDGRFAYRLADQHAYLLQDLPALFAGLVFAGANAAGGSEAYLTAEEVAWLDFEAADLVVLSACETGLGRAQSGEGMLGLRRAFHMAGARTVLSSLWMVRDAATSKLMQSFYKNLWLRGMSKREALRAAQLERLRANRRESGQARPSSWGAFVLSGDWR